MTALSQTSPLPVGTVVARRFKIVGATGSGGMGAVYRAYDRHTGQPVALKLLQPHGTTTADFERFAREAQMLSEMHHPGIVTYVAYGQMDSGLPFLAMEWLDGEDLARRLTRSILSLSECVALLGAVTNALAAAHQQGIVHRDIKPSNIFLQEGRIERVVLIDFGVARDVIRPSTLTRTGSIVGTPGYMAPEQARGDHDVGLSADIFSLGCVIHECLTGRPLFSGDHIAAILIKVLFEEAIPVGQLRPTVPPDLEALLKRMLAKAPSDRPADASALQAELAKLAPLGVESDAPTLAQPEQAIRSMIEGDQQVFSVVIAVPRAADAAEPPAFEPSEVQRADALHSSIQTRLGRLGAQSEWLADGSLVVTLMPAASAPDQAALAARCALLIKEQWPGADVALATGRGMLHARIPIGEAVDRALGLLKPRPSPEPTEGAAPHSADDGVLLDDLSAGLLDARFELKKGGSGVILRRELQAGDEARRLLGQPTPCVGRERELNQLGSVLLGCIEEPEARAVVITAPPGFGKSRVRHEFIQRIQAQQIDVQVLCGRGDPMTAGSPYSLLNQAVRRLCGVLGGEDASTQRERLETRLRRHVAPDHAARVVEFLGELCGIPFPGEHSPFLRAARNDAKIMRDQVIQAFVDFLRAECTYRPALLILEDLHWGDALTVKLVDVALRELSDCPLMVLALTRPDVAEQFPKLWSGRRVQEIRLGGLSRKASERLIEQVLGQALSRPISAQTLNRVIAQAGGNALFLEELIRAEAEGQGGALPETVLAMLQVRISSLEAGPRRALEAASIFGESFWRGGVLALLGSDVQPDWVQRWLSLLLDSEVIEESRESRLANEQEYRFRHALMRDAAYSLLTEQNRRIGHRLAGDFLERAGERDATVLAEHFYLGGELPRAVAQYIGAADQAAAAVDLPGVLLNAERGIACGADGEELGVLRGLQTDACMWRDELALAFQHGSEALPLLPRGGLRWCKLMASMFVITSLLGRTEEFVGLTTLFSGVRPSKDALTAYIDAATWIVALASVVGQRALAEGFLQIVEQVSGEIAERDPVIQGSMRFCQAMYARMLQPDPWRSVALARESEALARETGSLHNEILSSSFYGVGLKELGNEAEGERVLRAAIELAQRKEENLVLRNAMVYLSMLLADSSDRDRLEESARLAREVLSADRINPVVLGISHSALAHSRINMGDRGQAESEARAACELVSGMPSVRLHPMTVLMRALMQEGRAKEARDIGDAGLEEVERMGGAGYFEVPFRLAAAEARYATGDMVAARSALKDALRELTIRADHIPDADARERFLTRVPENARILELSRAWLSNE